MSAKKYERWTMRLAGNKRATALVRIERETPTRVVGVKVDRGGDEIGGDAGQRHVIIAAPTDILRRVPMAFSRQYGTLEIIKA